MAGSGQARAGGVGCLRAVTTLAYLAFVLLALAVGVYALVGTPDSSTSSDPGARWIAFYAVLNFFFGLSGLFNVIGKPNRSFQHAGRHKWRWLVGFVVATLLLFAPVLWLVWQFGPKRSLPGGIVWGARGGSGGGAQHATSWVPTTPSTGSDMYDQPRRCPTCNGSGRVNCTWCSWSGKDVNGNPCFTCGATRYMQCNSCYGSGTA